MTPTQDRGRGTSAAANLSRTLFILIVCALSVAALPQPAQAGEIPAFAVDANAVVSDADTHRLGGFLRKYFDTRKHPGCDKLRRIFQQLFQHPLTDKGLQGFLKDWEKARAVLGNIVEPSVRKAGR